MSRYIVMASIWSLYAVSGFQSAHAGLILLQTGETFCSTLNGNSIDDGLVFSIQATFDSSQPTITDDESALYTVFALSAIVDGTTYTAAVPTDSNVFLYFDGESYGAGIQGIGDSIQGNLNAYYSYVSPSFNYLAPTPAEFSSYTGHDCLSLTFLTTTGDVLELEYWPQNGITSQITSAPEPSGIFLASLGVIVGLSGAVHRRRQNRRLRPSISSAV